jgi:hypothetical protein
MPFSKHRRKPGGKSVRHPGRGREGKPAPEPPEWALYRQFADGYSNPFATKHEALIDMLDTIADLAFEPVNGGLQPVSKADVFSMFVDPDEPGHEAEDAEAAVKLLVEEGMVEVDGDEIRVPARFWPPV